MDIPKYIQDAANLPAGREGMGAFFKMVENTIAAGEKVVWFEQG